MRNETRELANSIDALVEFAAVLRDSMIEVGFKRKEAVAASVAFIIRTLKHYIQMEVNK